MRIENRYVYLGTNGTLETAIHLEGIYSVKKYALYADKGYKLTNGKTTTTFIVVAEEDLPNWTEIPE